ncbi:MAG: two-component regulator propeller domain-containing protein [Gammaproteobacteria bacterium]
MCCSLLISAQALAQDNWSWAEIPYDKSSSHIVADEQNIWVASSGGGVYRFDIEENTYQHYTRVNDGIADNQIYDLALDPQKNVWVATVKGLSVFMNDKWTTFNTQNSVELESDFITALAVDPVDGTLWVGTYDTGLYRYDVKTEIWEHYEIPDLTADYAFVTSIAVSKNGEVWIGVWGEGAYHFANGIWTRYDPGNSELLTYFVYIKAIEDNGRVWFWCEESTGQFSRTVSFYEPSNEWKAYLKGQIIHSLTIDDTGVTWAQSPTFLYKKQGEAFIPVKEVISDLNYSFPNARMLTTDKLGKLFVGSNQGISAHHAGNNEWIDYIPPSLWDSHINDLLIDDTDTKWIATRAGLHKITPDNKITVYTDTNSPLPSADIKGLALDKEKKLWMATMGGLVTYDGKKWKIFNTENSGLISNAIHSVEVADDGAVWVSFSMYAQGVQYFDGKHWQQFTTEDGLTSNAISQIYAHKKEVWLQSAQGVSIFKKNHWHQLTVGDGLLSNNITSIALQENHAWIGTDQGLVKYDGKNFEYIIDDLPKKYVSAIYEDPKGNLFVGTRDGGLSLLSTDKVWEHKDWHDGLTNMRIKQIVPDANQRLWLGTEFAVGITQPLISKNPFIKSER